MKRVPATAIALATWLFLGSGSYCGAVADWRPPLLVNGAVEQSQTQFQTRKQTETRLAHIRFNDAQRDYWFNVIVSAVESGELEHEVGALLLAANFGSSNHVLEPGGFHRLMSRAALRPDLLMALDIACTVLTPESTAPNSIATRRRDCDKFGARHRLTAIEPANAYHWVRRLDGDLQIGNRVMARAHLLAAGHSSYWRSELRTVAGLLHATLTRWPPSGELTEAARAVADSMPQIDPLNQTSDAGFYYEFWRDPNTFVALTVLRLIEKGPFPDPLPMLGLCREAVAAADDAGVAACRHLARLMIDAEDRTFEVSLGHTLLMDVEPPAAAARAEAERGALARELNSRYHALGDYEFRIDPVSDLDDLLNHGEVEMLRRRLARAEAQIAANANHPGPVESGFRDTDE